MAAASRKEIQTAAPATSPAAPKSEKMPAPTMAPTPMNAACRIVRRWAGGGLSPPPPRSLVVGRVPLRSLPLHNLHADNLPLFQPADVPAHLQERYLAVSASILYGATIESGAATLLHSRRPAARTTTFFIYDVSDLITP